MILSPVSFDDRPDSPLACLEPTTITLQQSPPLEDPVEDVARLFEHLMEEQPHPAPVEPPIVAAAAAAPDVDTARHTTFAKRPRAKSTNSLKLATVNVRGSTLESQPTAIVDVLTDYSVDVCVLTELAAGIVDLSVTDKHGEKWRFLKQASNTQMGSRGVGLIGRSHLFTARPSSWTTEWRVEDLRFRNSRILSFTLANSCHDFFVVGAYAPSGGPADNVDLFFAEVASMIHGNRRTILTGDLNAHIRFCDYPGNKVKPTSSSGQRLLTLMEAKDLHNVMRMFRHTGNMFTWKASGQPRFSTLDYMLCSKSIPRYLLLNAKQVLTPLETDHKMVSLSLLGPQATPKLRKKRMVVVRGNRSRRHLDPRRAPNFSADPSTSEDEAWKKLREYYAARQSSRTSYFLSPYITASTHALIRARQDACRLKRQCPSPANVQAFHDARTAARKALRQDKSNWYASVAKTACGLLKAGNIHGAFQTLRPLYKHQGRPTSIPSLDVLRQEVESFLNVPSPSRTQVNPAQIVFPSAPERPTPRVEEGPPAIYYTDGSAILDNNKWIGGYGVCLADEAHNPSVTLSGRVPGEATSDRAELYAAAIALWHATEQRRSKVEIHTDSAYLITMTSHFEQILASGGDAFVNGDILWPIANYCYMRGLSVTFSKVTAHTGVQCNECADQLANHGRVHGSMDDSTRAQAILQPPRRIPLPPNDEKPSFDEIADNIMKLSNFKSPGFDKIYVETLKLGVSAYRKNKSEQSAEDLQDIDALNSLVSLIQTCWTKHSVPSAWLLTPLTLIPKPGQPGKHRGIAVLSVFWKLISRIIANRLLSIPLHHIQHGFRARTGVLEAVTAHKLYLQAARITNTQLLGCYVDITRAYDSIDRTKLLELLESHGVGANIRGLLNYSFAHEQASLRLGGAYSKRFRTVRGVKQGDVASPLLFNIVMDKIIREFLDSADPHIATIPVGTQQVRLDPLFYADDGVIFATNSRSLEALVTRFSQLCAVFELEINVSKTHVLAFAHPVKNVNISADANIRRYHERRHHVAPNDHMNCAFCGVQVVVSDLPNHWETEGCKLHQAPYGASVHRGPIAAQGLALIEYLADHPEDPQISHYSQPRIPQPGIFAPPVPRDEFGRALVYNPNVHDLIHCPFGCATICKSRAQLCGHAIDKHSEQVLSLPRLKHLPNEPIWRCPNCEWVTDNRLMHTRHLTAASCSRRAQRTRLQTLLNQRTADRGLVSLDGKEISYVDEFKYLGRMVTAKDSDMQALFRAVRQATFRWHQLSHILRQKTLDKGSKKHLTTVIIHSALLFGSETWVMDKVKLRILRSFQQRILRSSFSVRGHVVDGTYHLPPRERVLRVADVEDVGQTLLRRRLAFYTRTLSRNEEFLPLKRLIVSFEEPGAETHQRFDGRRAWWTAQLRADLQSAGIPRMVCCVSHWQKMAKDHTFQI